ncbi:MAG: leucine-rich repeat domain-containing protein [Oligoflexales bacterium]
MPFLLRALFFTRRALAVLMWAYGMMRVKGWFPWLLLTVLALYFVSKVHESRAKNIFASAVFSVSFVFIIIASRSVQEPLPLDVVAKNWIQACEVQRQNPIIQSLQKFSGKETCEDIWFAVKKSSRLYLQSSSLESIELLSAFNHIRVLDLSDNNIKNLEVLQSFQSLQELNVSRNPVQKVKSLPVSLIDLNIASTHFEDADSLVHIVKIRSLDISYTKVSDLSPLKNLQHLNRLRMEGLQLFEGEKFNEALCPLNQGILGFQCKLIMESIR